MLTDWIGHPAWSLAAKSHLLHDPIVLEETGEEERTLSRIYNGSYRSHTPALEVCIHANSKRITAQRGLMGDTPMPGMKDQATLEDMWGSRSQKQGGSMKVSLI